MKFARFIYLLTLVWTPVASASWCVQLSAEYFNDSAFTMTKEIAVIGEIRKQCGGTCWIHAGLAAQEHRIKQGIGRDLPLSIEYPVIKVTEARFVKAVESGLISKETIIPELHIEKALGRELTAAELEKLVITNDVAPMADSGTAVIFQNLVENYGAIPATAFHASSAPRDWNSMKSRVLDAAKSFHNHYLTLQDSVAKQEYLKLASKWISDYLAKSIGTYETSFKVDGKEHTPQSFFQSFDRSSRSPSLFLFSSKHAKDSVSASSKNSNAYIVEPSMIVEQVKNAIDRGESAQIGMFWKRYLLATAGILNREIDAPRGDTTHGRHAVAVLGYSVDSNGKVKSFKLQNSWGKKKGKKGIFVIGVEEFLEAVISAHIVEP